MVTVQAVCGVSSGAGVSVAGAGVAVEVVVGVGSGAAVTAVDLAVGVSVTGVGGVGVVFVSSVAFSAFELSGMPALPPAIRTSTIPTTNTDDTRDESPNFFLIGFAKILRVYGIMNKPATVQLSPPRAAAMPSSAYRNTAKKKNPPNTHWMISRLRIYVLYLIRIVVATDVFYLNDRGGTPTIGDVRVDNPQ
jgi:hypothetical protein